MRALFFAFPAECAHTGVGRACTHAAQQADNCREGCRGKTRLDNQHAAAECRKHRRVLEYAGPLLQQNEREDDSEERRHFIKNVCICQYEMVNSVVIAEKCRSVPQVARMISSGRLPLSHLKQPFAAQHHGGHCHRDQIAEKNVFCVNGRSPARRTNAAIIAKTECGHDDKTDCLTFLESTGSLPSFFAVSFLTASIVTHKLFRVSEKSSVFRVFEIFLKKFEKRC